MPSRLTTVAHMLRPMPPLLSLVTTDLRAPASCACAGRSAHPNGTPGTPSSAMTANEAQANDVASASFVKARFFLFILINLQFWVYGLFSGGFLKRQPSQSEHGRPAETTPKMSPVRTPTPHNLDFDECVSTPAPSNGPTRRGKTPSRVCGRM